MMRRTSVSRAAIAGRWHHGCARRASHRYGLLAAGWATLILAGRLIGAPAAPAPSTIRDTIMFGDATSEQAHGLKADRSDTLNEGLGLPARRLLPLDSPSWEGGRASFTLQVDPERPNYFTVRLWGSDVIPNQLILFCEGKQVVVKVIRGVDQLFAAYRKNPRLAESDPATPNPDWFGLGPAGDVVRLAGGAAAGRAG